jgi:hypothetical protein
MTNLARWRWDRTSLMTNFQYREDIRTSQND